MSTPSGRGGAQSSLGRAVGGVARRFRRGGGGASPAAAVEVPRERSASSRPSRSPASSAAPAVPLSELLAGFRRYPQVLLNVRVAKKTAFAALPRVLATQRAVEERFGADGRLVLRYSGTEGLDQPSIEAMAASSPG